MQYVREVLRERLDCNDVNDTEILKLIQTMGFGYFEKGQLIFSQGDPSDFFFFNIKGKIDLFVPNPKIKPLMEELDQVRQDLKAIDE